MEELVGFYLGLGGIAAFIAFLINVLKHVGVVEDGTSNLWSTSLNLLGLVAVFILRVFRPDFDFGLLDGIAYDLAQAGTILLGVVLQLAVSKGTHSVVRGFPLIGKSYSDEARG